MLLTVALGRPVLFLITSGLLLSAELRIRLSDEKGQPVAARLEVHGPSGAMLQPTGGAIASLPPGRTNSGSPYLGSFVSRGTAVIQGQPGRYRIVAERGLEYEREEREVDAPGEVTIRLRPWVRMRSRGWWSGDLHVHRPMADVPMLLDAEDLHLGTVFTMWNRQNLWGDHPLPAADWIRQTGPERWMTVTNAEDERGGGAWMLHGLRKPLGIEKVLASPAERATESWDPPGVDFVRRARAQKQEGAALFPWFDLEKPIWWETPVMMALERPDSMGLLNNHYDQYSMYDNEAWGRKRDTARFPGPGGFSDYSLHLMYRYWNLGWLVTPTAGSASGVLPNPVGYNRIYVKLDGAFTVDKWYAGIGGGGARVMVSNGPLVFFDPRISADKRRLTGQIEAISRDRLDRVELVSNGQVVQSWRPGGRRFHARVNLDGLERHTWVAARAYAENAATVRLGHTAPIPLTGGAWAGRRDDARYFREWVEELQRNPKTPPGSKAAALYAEALAVYRAIEEAK